MTNNEYGEKQAGTLTRVGQNAAFAGFTRIGIVCLGVVLTAIFAWAAADMKSIISDIRENQKAIIILADRTTRAEDITTQTSRSVTEFRTWAGAQIQSLSEQNGTTGQRIYTDETSLNKVQSRVFCLEHHTVCPQ